MQSIPVLLPVSHTVLVISLILSAHQSLYISPINPISRFFSVLIPSSCTEARNSLACSLEAGKDC